MTDLLFEPHYRRPAPAPNHLTLAAKAAAKTFARWLERRRAQHHLERLPDRLLDDIGIERSQIAEAVRGGLSRGK